MVGNLSWWLPQARPHFQLERRQPFLEKMVIGFAYDGLVVASKRIWIKNRLLVKNK